MGIILLIGLAILAVVILKSRKGGLSVEPEPDPLYPLPPGTGGKISGGVTEQGNLKIPVPDMLVEANGYSTTTDANGNWQLWLPVGTYTVTISKAGYKTQSFKLSAQVGKSNSWNISLGPW